MLLDPDAFDKALEKLWIHGGAAVDYAENVSRGHDHWRESYLAQSQQKQQQLNLMLRYTDSNQCRMCALVRHSTTRPTAGNRAGYVISARPKPAWDNGSGRQRLRTCGGATRDSALRAGGGKSTGKLHAELFPEGRLSRNSFEDVLGAMARLNLVGLTDEVFEKDGRSIPTARRTWGMRPGS